MRNMAANTISILIVAGIVLLVAIGFAKREFSAPGPLREEVIVVLPKGAALKDTSRLLALHGAIGYEFLFRLGARSRRGGRAIARGGERRNPLETTGWWKEERSGVFIDYNQNARDRTVASAYSIRHTGWVSTPFLWDELSDMRPDAFDMMSFKDRWHDVGDLTEGIDAIPGRIDAGIMWVKRDEENGIGDAPWPPHHPKMPGEPARVQPSKRRMAD